jgi:two-component system LytT family sensor kinase
MSLTKHTYILQKLKIPLLLGLVFISIVHFLVLFFGYEIAWEIALTDSLVTNIIFAVVIGSISQFLTFYQRKKNNFIYAGFITSLEAAIASFIIIFILKKIHPDTVYIDFLNETTLIRVLFSLVICNSMVKGILLFNQLEEVSDKKAQEAKNKEILKDAELQKLQQQLQPHFLFNSLNSINALIITNPDEAGVMVQKLSDFLRYTTKNSGEQLVSLKEELKFLELYLDIEKVRFGHRLDIEKEINEKCMSAEIPTLILQPIVENAIKFGLYGTTEKVKITLSVSCDEKYTQIEVRNPFDKDMIPSKGTGFGLNGINRRLYLLYARNDLMETKTVDNIFIASLKIPIKK